MTTKIDKTIRRFEMPRDEKFFRDLPDERLVDPYTFMLLFRRAIRKKITRINKKRNTKISLREFCREYLEMNAPTYSRFMNRKRQGNDFKTVFQIRDKLLYGCSTHKIKSRYGLFRWSLYHFFEEKYWKYPTEKALSLSLKISPSIISKFRNKDKNKLSTKDVLIVTNMLNMTIEEIINREYNA